MTLFSSGIRPSIDAWLLEKSKEERNYGDYWSASSAGYCMRRVMYERLGVPHVQRDDDGRKQRVFTAGNLFHQWVQGITKDAGLSIAQELELQDEQLMVRGHVDDLVLVKTVEELNEDPTGGTGKYVSHLILYDYKTRNSKNFNFAKKLSYFHKLQVGTYMYMIRKLTADNLTILDSSLNVDKFDLKLVKALGEARILNIEKDTLRMAEVQLLWSEDLEAEVKTYWTTLNKYWADKKLPPCSCAEQENGFMAKEAWNPYFYNGRPCSIDLYQKFKQEKVHV